VKTKAELDAIVAMVAPFNGPLVVPVVELVADYRRLVSESEDCAENHYTCEEVAVLREALAEARRVVKSGMGWDDDEASVELVKRIDRVLK